MRAFSGTLTENWALTRLKIILRLNYKLSNYHKDGWKVTWGQTWCCRGHSGGGAATPPESLTECFHRLWRQAFILAFGQRECLQSLFGLLLSITWNWLSYTGHFWKPFDQTNSSRSLCGDGQIQVFNFWLHPARTGKLPPFTAKHWDESRCNCQNKE